MNPADLFINKPEHIVTIDFETYYDKDYTLKKLTTEAYILDPRFEVIGASIQVDDEPAEWFTPEQFAIAVTLIDWHKCAVLAHHNHFDGAILAWHYGVTPLMWLCTLSMSRALHPAIEVGGSLKKLMLHYGVGEKGEEVLLAMGKHRADFTEEEYAAYGRYCCNDTRGCREIFDIMMRNGFPDVELWNVDTIIRMFTHPQLMLHDSQMEEYLIWERERKQALLDRINQDKSILVSNDKFAALLVDMGEDPPTKISKARTKKARDKDPEAPAVWSWAFAKTDPGMQNLLESEREEIRWIAEARIGVKSSINETRTESFLAMSKRWKGFMPIYLKYYAAHTGRAGGGDKKNFQNLERVDKRNPRKGIIRKSLIAPKGKKVVVADSGQIEARGVGWISGHDSLVAEFAQGADIYTNFASEIWGYQVDKETPEGSVLRFIAKTMILGLGYSMGWFKFAGELAKGMIGGPPVKFTMVDAEKLGVRVDKFIASESNVNRVETMPSRMPLEERLIHCAVAQHLVWQYRGRNKPIVAFWKTMEHAIDAMVEGEELTFGPGDCLCTVRHGLLLPNGLTLHYPGLEKRSAEDDEDSDGGRVSYSYMGGKGGKERVKIYGGLFTENIVQALSRIIVFDQSLRIRAKSGISPATSTHDEIVSVPREEEAKELLKLKLEEMKIPSDWAAGWPVKAEGGIGDSYGAAKV